MTTLKENISSNERGFRSILATGMLVAIIVGVAASPTSIFVLTMASVYLVMTTMIGLDPAYTAREALTNTVCTRHNQAVTV